MFTYKFVMDIPMNLVSLFRVVIHRMTFYRAFTVVIGLVMTYFFLN
jgi:hypothetical protein